MSKLTAITIVFAAYVLIIVLLVTILVKVMRIVGDDGTGAIQSSALVVEIEGRTRMDLTVEVGQSWHARLREFTTTSPDPTREVAGPGPFSYMSDNPAVATIDGASGVGTAVSAGTATITGQDTGNGQVKTAVLTVAAPIIKSADLELAAG